MTNDETETWLVMYIGCLECGNPSRVIGLYADKYEADDVAEETECDTGDLIEVFSLPSVIG